MKQVLIVDDSPVIRKVARRILEGLRLQAAEAEDAAQGLEACAFLMPDVIFVDGKLPNVDGAAFVKELRKMPGGDKPRVIVVMSETDLAQTARARHCGADDIMLKPFDKAIMTAKIEDMGLLAA
jgi:two-component system chemotaxis response regulator CheY